MRGGGRRGGRGRGGGGGSGGGYGRRDTRPGGAASRDDRDRRDRRPDYSPRPRRSPSPRRHARRPRGDDNDDRDVSHGNRGPARGDRADYGGDRERSRGGRTNYGGDRDPPPSRGRGHREDYDRDRDLPNGGRMEDYGRDHGLPNGGRREDYGRDHDLTGRGRREDFGRDRDLPNEGRMEDYGRDHGLPNGGHDLPGRGRREDYGRDRDLHRDGRREHYGGIRDLPGDGRREDYSRDLELPRGRDYERAPYREERDRRERGANGTYDSPPPYMFPDHPSDLSRPSLRSERKESYYLGGPGRRSIDRERELLGDDGMTLRISASELGRTSALYPERRSPPSRAVLSPPLPPPPPLYPSVPPTDTGFLMGGSAMNAGDGFGLESTRFLQDDGKYGKHMRDPYDERGRGSGRHYSGGRDVPVEEDGGTDRRYPPADMPICRDRETDRPYSSRGMQGSDLVPCTQLKQIGDSPPSLLAKDGQYRMHSEPHFEPSNGRETNAFVMPSNDSLGHGSGRARRFSGSPFERGSGHSDEALLGITRQERSILAPSAEPMEFDGHPYVTRDPVLDTYLASEDLHGNVSKNPRLLSGSASLTGLRDERIDHHMRLSHRMSDDEDIYKATLHDSDHNLQNSDGAHASVPYPPARGGSGRYSDSPRLEPMNVRRPARKHEFSSFEDGRDLSDQEVSPMISRKRYRSPPYPGHAMDMPLADDGFTRQGYNSDDIDAHDLSPRRISRHYELIDEDEYDARYSMQNNRGVFSRLALPHEINGEWTDAEQESHPHSKALTYGHSKHKPLSQRLSRPTGHLRFGDSSIHGRGRGRGLTKIGKKKMRGALHQFHGGYSSPRNEFIRPNKFSKTSEDDPKQSEMNHEDAQECEDLPVQKDPPEGSEEFAKQVHEAFLKYSKMLNESPATQKKFRGAEKGALSCYVCGSVARKFPDLDALLSHAYDTCKAGLKTKHLGFHKALCVLMGWNWHVAPDTSKSHHSFPAEEVNAMKRDLMLWPPVVVMHNSSIAIETEDTEANIVSKEAIEGLLADMGIPREKVKVSHGRPANQSVFVVKFQPTISGFQEAMRIHDHFYARNHGKEEFLQMRGGKGKQAAPVDNLEELLYGHIAVAEDLGYLDEETKRRCFIRSKMDIEARADATLNLEP